MVSKWGALTVIQLRIDTYASIRMRHGSMRNLRMRKTEMTLFQENRKRDCLFKRKGRCKHRIAQCSDLGYKYKCKKVYEIWRFLPRSSVDGKNSSTAN